MNRLEPGESGGWQRDKLAESFFKQFMSAQKVIYSFILSLVPNVTVADDLIQETATVMWSKYNDFEQGSNFVAWGITVAKFRVLYYYRKEQNRTIQFGCDMLDEIASQAIKRSSDNLDNRLDALKQCIHKLSERDRQIVELRYDRGMKTKKVAEKLGRSVGGLYKTFARIHDLLGQCVKNKLAAEEAL